MALKKPSEKGQSKMKENSCFILLFDSLCFRLLSSKWFFFKNVKLPDTESANLALNKAVSSNGGCSLAGYGQAQSLTDGSNDPGSCPCINLNQKTPRWFVVDLARSVEVRSVVVTTAKSSAANANNFIVGLMETFDGTTWMDSGIGNYTLCARYPQQVASSLSYVVSCQGNPSAVQFVALIQDASTLPFAVCEIEVYGKYAI